MGCFSSCSLLVKTLARPMHRFGKVSKRVGEACVRRGLKILNFNHVIANQGLLRNGGRKRLTSYQLLPTAGPARTFQASTAVAWKRSTIWIDSPCTQKLHYLAGAGLSVFSAPSSTVWYPWRGEFTMGSFSPARRKHHSLNTEHWHLKWSTWVLQDTGGDAQPTEDGHRRSSVHDDSHDHNEEGSGEDHLTGFIHLVSE